MKATIYIGHHKVGSSALQLYLARNAHQLLQHEILYPCVEMTGFANLLARAVKHGDRDVGIAPNVREPHSALAYKMLEEVSGWRVPPQFSMLPAVPQMMHAIRSQIGQLQPKHVILCSEIFSYFGEIDPSLITRLRGAFPEHVDMQVYCALRRPDEYLVSLHGQGLKVGDSTESLRDEALPRYLPSVHFNFHQVIAKWHELLPKAQITIRNYDDILAAGGSVEDFKAQVDCDFPEDTIPAGIKNKGLHRATFEIVRLGNLQLEPPSAHRLRMHLLKTQGNYDLPPGRDIEMFSPGAREMLYENFLPIHEYLTQISGTEAFFPDLEDMKTPRPVPEMDAAQMLLDQLSPDDMPDEASAAFIAELQSHSDS